MAKFPIEEFIEEDVFTDREAELTFLQTWYREIAQGKSTSQALISPRRLGKTALLERFVNTVFFNDFGVAPFYYYRGRDTTTLRGFLLNYATTFFRQYIAYLLQDPLLYRNPEITLSELATLKTADQRIKIVQKSIVSFLQRYENDDLTAMRMQWEQMVELPEFIASRTGVNVAVIIDEFQDLKTQIFNKPEGSKLDPVNDWPIDLTASFSRQSQSKKAPLLVSGSAVTMIFKTVMGGPLGGRFSFFYLKPMSIADGAELAKRLIDEIDDELANYLSFQLGGHPYYITCCAKSKAPVRGFASRAQIDKLIDYEIEKGDIAGFWQTHFQENKALINQDDDAKLGQKIFYYFTKYNNQQVQIGEIAKQLRVTNQVVEAKIEKLYQADLVFRQGVRYYAFNDHMLMRFIRNSYHEGVEGVDAVPFRVRGFDNYYKGQALELLVQNLFRTFNKEKLPGELFNVGGEVTVPKFSQVGSIKAKLPATSEYEIDIYGEYEDGQEKKVWLTECKYRAQRRLDRQEVERTLQASEAVKEQYTASSVVVWFISTAGFTAAAQKLIAEQGCLSSTRTELNLLARRYGITTTLD